MTEFTGTTGDDKIIGTAEFDSIDVSQGGIDTVRAGAGGDTISIGGELTKADRIDGGADSDILNLNGD